MRDLIDIAVDERRMVQAVVSVLRLAIDRSRRAGEHDEAERLEARLSEWNL